MTAFLMQVSASTFAQKITLNEKEASLVSIFEKINKQSGVDFLVNIELLSKAKPVSINVNDEELAVVLDRIFKGQPFQYSIKDKAVVVTKKTPSFLERLADRWAAIDVHGRVVDQEGKALSGATVKVKGTGKSVGTSAKGEFYLEKVEEDAVLVISFIGYLNREVNVQKEIGNVVLELSDSKLDEVQVIAYGEVKKKLLTSNIGGIKAKDIETQPVVNPLLALQGRVSGIFINQNNGYNGGGITVRIQGQNSIGNGSDPFYVVDGVPYISQLLPSRSLILGSSGGSGNESGQGNPFNFLNPADIESIDVLKDADATAIYGSRAANGAILITTKKGKAGRTKLDFNLQNGIAKVAKKMKLLNTQQYLEMRREAYTNDGLPIPTPLSNKALSNYDLTVYDPNRYTDWQKEFYGGIANYSDGQLTISGGSANTTFRLNGGYHRQTFILPGDYLNKKGSVGVNVNHTSTDNKFKLNFSGNLQSDNNKLPYEDITIRVLQLAPNAPALRTSDGKINWSRIETNPITQDSTSTFGRNPLGVLERKYQVKTSNLVSNLNLSYLLAKGLIVKASLGYTDLISNDVVQNPLTAYPPEQQESNNRGGNYSDSRAKSWVLEPQINYDFNLAGGQATFLLGSTFQQNTNDMKAINADGFSSDEVIPNFQAASKITAAGSIQSIYKYNAMFGRFNYSWHDKYVLNLTARRDGSSRFGAENRFENFGAIGAAWIFSNEESIKNSLPFLTFGKLRASYGTTGSDQIGNYTYLNLYNNVTPAVPYQGFTGLTPAGLPNPYLQWELTKKLQGGIDIAVFDNRISLSVGYYNNRSSNQLLDYSLPTQTGYDGLLQNFPAKIGNSGWEFNLNTTNVHNRKFIWTSSINLTISRNKLLEFPGFETSSYTNRLIIGEPITILKRLEFAGVDIETGLNQYRALDGKIVDVPEDFVKDMYIPVDLSPRFYGGFQNSLSYKDFSIDFLFQFVRRKAEKRITGFSGSVGNNQNQPIEVLNRWQKPGDETNIKKYTVFNNDSYVGFSTISYGDASYIRLKNISLSYNLPTRWAQFIHLERFRIFAQGQNILTITDYLGLDPETPGNGTLPPLRTITFGLQVTL
jgi:TonB-linked SusC/RagA family outer membrane protein